MIRAESITIEEFRGIRSLSIDFGGKNFAICGPNGTGKSGIVDALEFVLTGSISRLSGKGMGNVSVKDHAPHVDSRNRPDKARVVLVATAVPLGRQITIERSVKDAGNPKVTPDTPEVRAFLAQVSIHPEFVLSRRELIRYVLSSPGDRAKEVQALLRLQGVEDVRTALLKISNSKQREVPPLEREKTTARGQLSTALGLTDLKREKLLEAVNQRRAVLGLASLSEIAPSTSLRDGLATAPAPQIAKIAKAQSLADLKQLQLSVERVVRMGAEIDALTMELETLQATPEARDSLAREQFLTTSLQMIQDDACPVCDTPWESVELRAAIQGKLKRFTEASAKRATLEKQTQPLLEVLQDLVSGLLIASKCGPLLSPPVDISALTKFKKEAETQRLQLQSFASLPQVIAALRTFRKLPAHVLSTVTALETAVTALPERTDQETARDYLTIAQERLETWRHLSAQHKRAEEQAALAKKVLDAYAAASTAVLEGIYKQVEGDFTGLYREVNKDDESGFTAQLVAASGKLDLDVDFFGRGFFPPGAYHSEGHQDGMGICLYLALMRHLLGSGFSFAVLDDVLMSVDAGHRREICNVLKKHFPETQFIFTTHDEIWLQHMRSVGLIRSGAAIQFRNWDVDHGPTRWDDRDIWQQIRDEMKSNSVRAAAALMRHYLEHASSELCHLLGAHVRFRSDARFELGELLPSAIGRYKELLKKGKAAAQSWGKKSDIEAITAQEGAFQKLLDASNVERWMINAAVHYNQWENLQPADFAPVVTAFERLMNAFVCQNPDCGGILYASPERGESEQLRCSCGATNINLVRKPPAAA